APAGNPEFGLVIHRDRFRRLKRFFRNTQVTFFGDSQLGFDLPKAKVVWTYFQPAVDRFISRPEIAQRRVTESEILKHPTVFRIENGCFLETGVRFRPFPHAALDRPEGEITLGLVRQTALCDFELFERSLEIVVAVIERKSHSEMRLGRSGCNCKACCASVRAFCRRSA